MFSLHKDCPFLPEKKKIKKCEKLICDIKDKEKYVVRIRTLKQALNHDLELKRVCRVIQFIQKAWKKILKKDFFKLMNNSVFGKTMENVRNYRDIKLVTTDKKRKKIVSEPNYHMIRKFSEYLMAIEMKKAKVKMNKPVYLDMSILDISKTLIYEFWYDYIKPKYEDAAKLCYVDTDSFIIHIKIEDFYENIADDVERCI